MVIFVVDGFYVIEKSLFWWLLLLVVVIGGQNEETISQYNQGKAFISVGFDPY